jgi:hypothetical protein
LPAPRSESSAEPFKDWRKAFWDNLATSIQLHHIKKVIAIDPSRLRRAKIAYGAEKVTDRKVETETHRTAMAEFRKQVAERHPALKVETRPDGGQTARSRCLPDAARVSNVRSRHAPCHSSRPPRIR